MPEDETGICVIRSHGASPQVFEEVKNKGYEVVDLTCPDVKKVQQKAIQLVQEGFLLIILGKPEHPEVLAIKANAQKHGENVYVIPDLLTLHTIKDKVKEHKRIGVVVQTTQRVQLLQEVVDYLTPLSKELKIFNTICASTTYRQNEARDLAQESDLMIVVGSKKSANTTHLAEILTNITTTVHIETDCELDQYKEMIKNAKNISITAGASTPEDIIQRVIKEINKY